LSFLFYTVSFLVVGFVSGMHRTNVAADSGRRSATPLAAELGVRLLTVNYGILKRKDGDEQQRKM
jgi:hypothetical protein